MPSRCNAFSMISVALLTGLPFAWRPGLAQQQPAQQPSGSLPAITTLHSTARVVVLDVVVSDGKGTPAKGLKQSDFTLYEDGVRQTILSFTEHDAVVGSKQMPTLPPNTFAVQPPYTGDGATTVVVFGHLDVADAPWARKQLQGYLKATQPNTPMAIVREDNNTHLIQPLTSDRSVLLAAVSSDRIFLANGSARVPGFRPTFNLQRYLATIPGHINLIWFATHGGGEHPFPDILDFVDNTSVLQLSRIAIFPMDAHGVDFYDSGVGETPLGVNGHSPMVNVRGVMGPLGPGSNFGKNGTTFFNSPMDQDWATKNGGRSYHSNHSYVPAITEVVNTGAHYYTISYTPTNHDWNNQYRSIRLDVPGYSTTRPGVLETAFGLDNKNEFKLMYRRGYYARADAPVPLVAPACAEQHPEQTPAANAPCSLVSSSFGAARARRSSTPMATAMVFASPTPLALRFAVTVTPEPEAAASDPAAGNSVTAPFQSLPRRLYRIHYRIDPSQLNLLAAADGSYSDNLQFDAVVYRDDGVAANLLDSPGHIAFPAADLGRLMKTPFGFDQVVAVPTGSSFYLRTGVHEISTNRIGAIELPLSEIQPLP